MSELAVDVKRLAENQADGKFTSGCQGKIRHATYSEAKRSAKVMHKRYHRQFDAYECRFCKDFHVGTRRSPEARAKIRASHSD